MWCTRRDRQTGKPDVTARDILPPSYYNHSEVAILVVTVARHLVVLSYFSEDNKVSRAHAYAPEVPQTKVFGSGVVHDAPKSHKKNPAYSPKFPILKPLEAPQGTLHLTIREPSAR